MEAPVRKSLFVLATAVLAVSACSDQATSPFTKQLALVPLAAVDSVTVATDKTSLTSNGDVAKVTFTAWSGGVAQNSAEYASRGKVEWIVKDSVSLVSTSISADTLMVSETGQPGVVRVLAKVKGTLSRGVRISLANGVVPDSITIGPKMDTLTFVGDVSPLLATAWKNGIALDPATLPWQWSVFGDGLGMVIADDVNESMTILEEAAPSFVKVKATVRGVTSLASLVALRQYEDAIEVTSTTEKVLLVGQTHTVTGRVLDSGGSPKTTAGGTTMTDFQSSNTAAATVNSTSGVVTAVADGSTTITVSREITAARDPNVGNVLTVDDHVHVLGTPTLTSAVTGAAGTQGILGWTDNSTANDSYKVFRSTNGGGFSDLSAGLGANATSHTDATATTTNTRFSYQLFACRDTTCTVASNTLTIGTTPSAPASPTAICINGAGGTAVTCPTTGTGNKNMRFTWTDNSATETKFEVERSLNGAAFTVINSNVASSTETGSSTTYSIEQLLQDSKVTGVTQTYTYRARACRNTGISGGGQVCSAYATAAGI
jgi:hypothetical protein